MRERHSYTDQPERIFGKSSWDWNSTSGFFTIGLDDEIFAKGGNDTVLAGDGDDIVHTGSGNDSVRGGAGNDTLFGDQGRDTLYGDAGNDSIVGGDERSELYGGADNDTLVGGEAGGTLEGGEGHDSLIATDIFGSQLDGGSGNDTLRGHIGDDAIFAGTGDDLIYLSSGIDQIDGGEDNDTFLLDGTTGTWDYGPRDFLVLIGGAGYDVLDLRDATNNVTVFTGIGNPYGIRQVEEVWLGSGNDRMAFMTDVIYADLGGGNDTVTPVSGQSLQGGSGMDTVDMSDWTSATIIDTDPTLSENLIGSGVQLRGFERYLFGKGNDRFESSERDESALLGRGDDIAFGNGGNDSIDGQIGEDFLNGGTGNDTLQGGQNADEFHFDIDRPFGHDVINDWRKVENDSIVLDTNGGMTRLVRLKEQGEDVVITVLGFADSSITVKGAATRLKLSDIEIGNAFDPIDPIDLDFDPFIF